MDAPVTRIPSGLQEVLFSKPVFYGNVRGESRGGPRFDNRAFVRVYPVYENGGMTGGIQVGNGHGWSSSYGRFVAILTDQNVGNSVTNSVEDLAWEVARLIRTHQAMEGIPLDPQSIIFIEHYPATIGTPRRSEQGDHAIVDLEWPQDGSNHKPKNPIWKAIADEQLDDLIGHTYWRADQSLVIPRADASPVLARKDEENGVLMATNIADDSLMDVLRQVSSLGIKVEVKTKQDCLIRYFHAGGIYPDWHPLACAWIATATGKIGVNAKPFDLSSILSIKHKGETLWKIHA